MFPLYLQYLLIDFRQTLVTGASWDTDDLITFLGQKFKVQGHTIAAEAHSTRRYHQVQLFLVHEIFLDGCVWPREQSVRILVAVQITIRVPGFYGFNSLSAFLLVVEQGWKKS